MVGGTEEPWVDQEKEALPREIVRILVEDPRDGDRKVLCPIARRRSVGDLRAMIASRVGLATSEFELESWCAEEYALVQDSDKVEDVFDDYGIARCRTTRRRGRPRKNANVAKPKTKRRREALETPQADVESAEPLAAGDEVWANFGRDGWKRCRVASRSDDILELVLNDGTRHAAPAATCRRSAPFRSSRRASAIAARSAVSSSAAVALAVATKYDEAAKQKEEEESRRPQAKPDETFDQDTEDEDDATQDEEVPDLKPATPKAADPPPPFQSTTLITAPPPPLPAPAPPSPPGPLQEQQEQEEEGLEDEEAAPPLADPEATAASL